MKNQMNDRAKTVKVRHFRVSRRSGFTLIEVMISIALVLMLTYGIAQVFKLSSDTVGTTQAVANFSRDQRAAGATLAEDFRNCASDSPLFLISSQVGYDGPLGASPPPRSESLNNRTVFRGYPCGFKNALEESQSTDPNHDPTRYDVNGKQFFADFNMYTDRTPRMDRLGFFARGLYRRQTASNAQTYSGTTSNEAYIWYGLAAKPGLPSGGAGVLQKGSPYANNLYMTIPQNQYAQDRILGRMAILLKDSATVATDPIEFSNSLGFGGVFTKPIDWDSQAWVSYSDLALITIDQWRALSQPWFVGNKNGWFATMEDNEHDPLNSAQQKTIAKTPLLQKMWWGNCQPVLERPITSQKMAQSAPAFISHCTQFIVEYAGDYLAQDPVTGNITDSPLHVVNGVSGKTDGEIDFIMDHSNVDRSNPNQPNTTQGVKRIRWYGLPRSIHGDDHIKIDDVVPLADVLENAGLVGIVAPWEKVLPNPSLRLLGNDYGRFKASNGLSPQNFKYVCAWRDDAPPMIRILMKLDDPSGRLQEGQWYEYVLSR